MNNINTVTELFLDRIKRYPQDVVYTYKEEGVWVDVTWQEYGRNVHDLTNALMAAGLKPGEKAVCLSNNRLEWYYYAMSVVMARGVIVGIYPTNPARECKYIIEHSDARFLLVEDQEQVDKVLSILDQVPALEKVIVIEKYEPQKHPLLMALDEFYESGRDYAAENSGQYEQRAREAEPTEVLSLVYTSGTTGHPKGAMLSHQQILGLAEISLKHYGLTRNDLYLDFLPLAHIGGMVVGHYFRLYSRIPAVIAEGWYDAVHNAWEVEPTTFISTPRMFEKFYNNILSKVDDATRFQQLIFKLSLSMGAKIVHLKQNKKPLPLKLKIGYKLADFFVFSKFRDILGGRIRFLVSGGAPLSAKVVEFFHIIRIPILEVFGQTETTAWVSMNGFEEYRIGSVGRPIPGNEIKINEDGEILCRGPGNCLGYYKNEEASRTLVDEEGWLYTGDIGEFDEDGFLFITDRKKDIFITAGGKNVAPGNIENLLKTSKYISQAMVYGDGKKYLVALLTLDEEEVTKHARDNRIIFKDTKELTQKPEIYKLIKKEIDEKNIELSSVETIKNFLVLKEELDEDKEEVTATQKVKRAVLTKKYQKEMEALYR